MWYWWVFRLWKILVDKLVEKCSENVEEVKLAKITSTKDENKHENKCCSCTLYIVLISIIFRINVGIGTYFAYYKYINGDKKTDGKKKFIFQTAITKRNSVKLINGANQRNKHQKSNLLSF